MIIVSVMLYSAVTHEATELARMEIANDGEGSSLNPNFGDYGCVTLKGRSAEQLNKRKPQRTGQIKHHARKAQHVWNLVAKCLHTMGYGNPNP